MTIERLLRAAAIVIAVLGVVDPVITADRAVTPTVAVIETGPRGGATRPADLGPLPVALGPKYRLVRGPSLDAAATVVVGRQLPDFAESVTAPAFVVVPDPPAGSITIRRVTAPSHARFDSRIPVTVSVQAAGAAGRQLTVRLDGGGLMHDRVEQKIDRDGLLEIPLTFVAPARGITHLRISASLGADETVAADTAVDVDDRRWSVLFFDRRPSWMSTFVRRALEQDPRFDVDSRVVTSTGVVAVTGRPPDALRDLASLRGYDAIAVGAPDALTREDVGGLDAFARKRGGAVVVFLEQPQAGLAGPLVGITRWQETRTAEPVAIQPRFDGLAPVHATELLTPAADESDRDKLAAVAPGTSLSLASPSPLLESPLGAGRILVSGLVDAWRYRGVPGSSAFDTLFQFVMGRAADGSPPAVDVRLDSAVLAPGQPAILDVTLRDIVLADSASGPGSVTVEAALTGPGLASAVRLWPHAGLGRFRGTLRAPTLPGTYQIIVTAGSDRGAAPLVVIDQRSRPDDTQGALLAAWATTRGGRVVPAADAHALEVALASAIPVVRRPARLHPFQSAWWIAGFAGALGGEWWLRRRRNLK